MCKFSEQFLNILQKIEFKHLGDSTPTHHILSIVSECARCGYEHHHHFNVLDDAQLFGGQEFLFLLLQLALLLITDFCQLIVKEMRFYQPLLVFIMLLILLILWTNL